MGNNITKEYDVDSKRLIATGGIGLSWKVYNATKKTTGQLVSVFIFEKKAALDAMMKRQQRNAKDIDKLCTLLKKEVSTLSRLRHPCLLEIVEPISESATTLAFATERLMGNLANVLGNYQNFDNIIDRSIEKYELDEIEIQKGLLQLAKGLQFCHNDAKIVHSNLVPSAVYINAKGDWKLGGFNFSMYLNYQANEAPRDIPEFDSQLPSHLEPSLDFAAPEFILDRNVNYAMDMFSFGCFIYSLYNRGQSLMANHSNILSYRSNIDKLAMLPLNNLPPTLDHVLRSMLTRTPQGRLTAAEFQGLKYFDNVLITTIRYVETLCEKPNIHKAQFMKGLIRVLPQFPERVLTRKILPALLAELKEHVLTPFTLPNVFWIAEKLSQREFMERVMPLLKPCFTLKDPIQCSMTCLTHIQLLQSKTSSAVFRDDVMPLLYTALESNVPAAQERCFDVIPTVVETIDYSAVKSALFPRICNVFAQTPSMSAKVSALKCCHQLLKVLDKGAMSEKLLPILRQSKIRDPGVQMGILKILHEMGKEHLEKEVVATEILPELWRISIDPLLSVSQFKAFMAAIKELTAKVEEQHMRHLAELKTMEDQSKSMASMSGNAAPTDVSDFEQLLKAGPVDPDMPFEVSSKSPNALARPIVPPSTNIAAPTVAPMRLAPPPAQSNSSTVYNIPALQPPPAPRPANGLAFGATTSGGSFSNGTGFRNTLQQNMAALSMNSSPAQTSSFPSATTQWPSANSSQQFSGMIQQQQQQQPMAPLPQQQPFAFGGGGGVSGNGYNAVATFGSASSLSSLNPLTPTSITPNAQKTAASQQANQKGLINMFDPYA
ncbi:Protein kinase domain-containing protein ppk32 [Sorochytrium milnesiophthora]